MRSNRLIHVVHVHAEGEVGDVIVGGAPMPPGDTLWDRRSWIAEDGALRRFLLNEPRGGVFRHVNLLTPPTDPAADAAFIVMEPEDTPPMSGSNTICVATALLETGILPMREPETRLTLQAPGGLVPVVAACRDGKVLSVTLQNLTSFVDRLDAVLEVPGVGALTVDTAFGGDSFVIADAKDLGFALTPDEARDIAVIGARVTDAANEQLPFAHPEADWRHISFCQIAGSLTEAPDGALEGVNAVAIKPGKIDRSPCGTGASARLATLHARGRLGLGGVYRARSLIGSTFHCRIEAEAQVADRPAVIPSVSGRAWLYGASQWMCDPDDPWPEGYRLSDTWPGASSA